MIVFLLPLFEFQELKPNKTLLVLSSIVCKSQNDNKSVNLCYLLIALSTRNYPEIKENSRNTRN